MLKEIDGPAARRMLGALIDLGWVSARRGLEILASLNEFSYHAAPAARGDVEALYSSRAMGLQDRGSETEELDRFLEAIRGSSLTEVLVFSVSRNDWSCVCVVAPNLRDVVGSTAIRIGQVPERIFP